MQGVVDNPWFQGVLIAMGIALIMWGIRLLRFRMDEARVIDFLSNSEQTFRSTEAIVSATRIPRPRVWVVCSRSPRITRNSKKRETWRLT